MVPRWSMTMMPSTAASITARQRASDRRSASTDSIEPRAFFITTRCYLFIARPLPGETSAGAAFFPAGMAHARATGERRRIMRGITTALMLSATLAGCATMTVGSHSERGVDFSEYVTYDWGGRDSLPVG